MQFQVPQFIDTEDKVVGPFSLRQFAYVGGAALVTGICYFLLQTWLAVVIGLVLVGGALALSFVKINGRPLITVVLAAMNFYWKPQVYIWKADRSTASTRQQSHSSAPAVRELPPLQTIAQGDSLHKSWENLQTGTAADGKIMSGRQFVEKKMAERYQIFRRAGGDRMAARRVDYR